MLLPLSIPACVTLELHHRLRSGLRLDFPAGFKFRDSRLGNASPSLESFPIGENVFIVLSQNAFTPPSPPRCATEVDVRNNAWPPLAAFRVSCVIISKTDLLSFSQRSHFPPAPPPTSKRRRLLRVEPQLKSQVLSG